MSQDKLSQIHDREVQDRRRTTLHVVALGTAILVIASAVVVAAQSIAMTIG